MDDLERRLNPLFDALNCETLSKPVQEKLLVLSRGKHLVQHRRIMTNRWFWLQLLRRMTATGP